MRKILFLIHTLRGGGAEKALVQLVNSMDKSKFDITVMTVVNTGKYIKELNPNIKYKYMFKEFIDTNTMDKRNIIHLIRYVKLQLYYNVFWKMTSTKRLYRKHIKEEYDVEVSFLEGIPAKVISGSSNKKSKKICWIHTDLTKNKKTKQFFKNKKEEKECYLKFDNVVCVSEIVKEHFLEEIDIKDNKKIIVRHNPLDIKKILKKSNEKYKSIYRELKSNNNKIICSVGRLETLKGYDRLLKAHKRLIDEGIKHKLIILGEGSQYEKLKKYILDNGLEESAKLMGFRNNPYPYIKASDIYICSSIYEGLNIAVCEAMVLGKPIIVTKGTGFKGILGANNEHGIIAENSEQGIYEGIKTMLQDESKMVEYAKESRQTAQMFELKRNVRNIEKLFK